MSFNPSHPFLVPPLPPRGVDLNTPELLKKVIRARGHLSELNGYSAAMPNPGLLMAPFIIQESVASSAIENINTTVVEFIQGQLFPETEQRAPDKEVARYREALLWGHENLPKVALSTRLIIGIQKTLLEKPEQGYRKLQNKIENTAAKETIYTPPIAAAIPKLMGSWEDFANETGEDIDPLIRCALSHYQFEAIHPFSDGNGRTGRILMVLQLVSHKILNTPILFISGYLNKNRSEYYRVLNAVTKTGDWHGYLNFMLDGFCEQSMQTKQSLFKIKALHEEMKEKIKKNHPSAYSAELVDQLFMQPITTPVKLGTALGVHYTTASKKLKALSDAGILATRKVGKHQFYANSKLIELLSK